jgi:hypothetical protein
MGLGLWSIPKCSKTREEMICAAMMIEIMAAEPNGLTDRIVAAT